MALTLEEIRQSDPFITEDTNLDLSAYPWLTPLADAPVDDGKFAPVDRRGMGIGGSALKEFLANPDRESVVELRDPEALKKFDEQHGGGTTVFASGIPFQVYQRGGKWYAKGKVSGQLHRFTADSRDALYPKISNAVGETSVKELTESELLAVARIAATGNRPAAINQYLLFAIPESFAAKYDDRNEVINNPSFTGFM